LISKARKNMSRQSSSLPVSVTSSSQNGPGPSRQSGPGPSSQSGGPSRQSGPGPSSQSGGPSRQSGPGPSRQSHRFVAALSPRRQPYSLPRRHRGNS
ncbi:2432_t:CDS:1, partial [Ambispora leptoticha]